MTVATSTFGSADPKPKQMASSKNSSKSRVRNGLKMILKLILVVIAFVLYSAVIPVFFIFMIPLYAYRGIVIILQKLLKPDWVGIMCSRDAVVGMDDTTKECKCMILASVVYKGVPDIERCRKHFQENVMEAKAPNGEMLYRKLTHYYENWLGYPFWKKETDFKLEEHLRMFDYNIKSTNMGGESGEEYVTEDELLRRLGEMEALPFGNGKSPWEILVIPNFIPREGDLHKDYNVPEMTVADLSKNKSDDKYFTLVYRVHHAIGDGYSFLKMLMCHLCNCPVESVPKAPTRNHNIFVSILHAIAIIFFTPYYHFKQFFIEIDKSIWHLPENKLSKRSHFVTTERIPLEKLKDIGKAFKVPLTGVFLAGLSGGIHNFLKLTGKGHMIPKYMRAFSPMPWENHPVFEDDGMVNHWTCGVFAIPVREDTPLKRLRASKKAMRDLVNSPVLFSNFFTIPILLSAPNFLTDLWGTNWMTSMILSNFPGPKKPTKSFGKYYLDNIVTFVPHMRGSAGLGVMFPTVLGKVRCTVSVDTSILKDYSDVQFLVSLIDEEFRILRTLHLPNSEDRV